VTTEHDDDGHTDVAPAPEERPTPQSTTGDIDADLKEILSLYMESIEQQIERARRCLAVEVLPALLACGVANIEIAYSGYGDSGAIDGVQYRDANGLRVVRDNLPQGVREQLETCVYAFLPVGFENNDGSQGSLTIDLTTRKITLQHEQNEICGRQSIREWEV
jgi:hypothetical protein